MDGCFTLPMIGVVITLVGMLTAPIVTGMGYVFRELSKVQRERIVYMEKQLDKALTVGEGGVRAADNLAEKARKELELT